MTVFSSIASVAYSLPPVDLVQEEAINFAGLSSDPSWNNRIRWAALVPEYARVEYSSVGENDWQRTERYDTGYDGMVEVPDDRERRAVIDNDHQEVWRAGLTWDLTPLVWSRDELAIDGQLADRQEQRQELLEEVTELYFTILETENRLEIFDGTELARLRLQRERDQAWALLNALTGGLLALHDAN